MSERDIDTRVEEKLIEDVKNHRCSFLISRPIYVVFHGHFEKKIAFGTNWNQSSRGLPEKIYTKLA